MKLKNKIHALKAGKKLFRVQGGYCDKDIRFVFAPNQEHVSNRFISSENGPEWKVRQVPLWWCFFTMKGDSK